ncbi:MAG: DUF4924 family protein [Bacteroides sp.]|nr:DUF4924 family protein [Bacteroides sp.]
MYIARQLKEENIIEYLLYMWQVEDMIRATGFDSDSLYRNIIMKYELPDEERKQLQEWYENITNMMHEEGVTETGHLQINKNVLQNLTELHQQLLSTPKYPFYTAVYYKALPFIVELRNRSKNTDKSELETSFEALYGVLLLKMQKKEITPETSKAIEAIRNMLSMLANYYIKDKNGELDFE